MIKEFREFIMRGNVFDMAVGVIIGAVFGKIVGSLVGDVLMPPIGMLMASVDFSDLVITLKAAQGDKPAVVIGYGKFLTAILDFVIVAFVIFMLVKGINRLKREAVKPPTTRDCPECLSAIPIKAVRCAHCASEVKPA